MNPQKVKEVTPLDIAPEEIWMYIFELLETSELVDVSLSCRSFSNFLREKKVTFLFGKVLPLIATSLDLDSLLACRGVSRQWRAETNIFLESRAFTEMSDLDDETRRKKNAARLLCPTLKFDMEKMAQFHKSMKDHPTNPFVGRTVKLNLKEDEFGTVVKDTVELFIDAFGKHIWHFEYHDKSEPDNYDDWMTMDGAYGFFKNIADAMPNLRSLCFSMDTLKDSDSDPEDDILEDNRLNDLMAASPLPNLPFLEMLNLDFGDSNLDRELPPRHCPWHCQTLYRNIFSAYGPQLKRLEIYWYYWSPSFPMKNLTELRLQFFESNESLKWLKKVFHRKRIDSSRPSPTEISLPSLIRLETQFLFNELDIDCFMICLQEIREYCGGFQILRLSLYIPPVEDDSHGAILNNDIVLPQKPDNYDSEVEWLRFMITEFVKQAEQTRLIDLGRMVTGQ